VPPQHLVANIYYVGAIGVSSYLITTPEGHILRETGFEETVPVIRRSVEQLRFRLGDIKLMLSSPALGDHVGGHALMKRLTGARIFASAADAHVMATGGSDDFIPYPRALILCPPVQADRIIRDGEQVTLGNVTLTAHLTPGHTKGAATWTMEVTEEGRLRPVVFFSSASISPGTTLVHNPAYPEIAADLTAIFAKLKTLPCEVFFAPHGGQFAIAEKFERLKAGVRPNPFIDPDGWRARLASMEDAFLKQLETEKAARPK
jgi:metallo-beta-lactamase class B